MLRLSVSTSIAVAEPSDDGGFITWFEILIHRERLADDGDAGGGDLDDGDEKVELIGRATLAIVHVGAVVNRGDSLYEALDAALCANAS